MTPRFSGVTRALGRRSLTLQKNSPSLLFGAGMVGMVGSTILACRATLKLEDVLNQTQVDLAMAKTVEADSSDDVYSKQDLRKDTAIIYVRSIGAITKLYAPAVLLGVASAGCLTKSHNMLTQRNLALTAAYAAVDSAFAKYRERVVEKYGPEQDQLFRYDSEQVEVLDDAGRMTTHTRVAPSDPSMYARFFDQFSTEWDRNPEYNLVFLRCQQNWANDTLKTRGHVFLNEVYDRLGLPRTSAGSVVGWVISDDGDNFVDFGLYDTRQEVRDFVNGREGSILLDFNVDGVIWDKIEPGNRREIGWQN